MYSSLINGFHKHVDLLYDRYLLTLVSSCISRCPLHKPMSLHCAVCLQSLLIGIYRSRNFGGGGGGQKHEI